METQINEPRSEAAEAEIAFLRGGIANRRSDTLKRTVIANVDAHPEWTFRECYEDAAARCAQGTGKNPQKYPFNFDN